VLQLWIESNVFWISNRNVGSADAGAARLIERLKAIAGAYDASVVDEVEVLKGKSKAKRAPVLQAKSSTTDKVCNGSASLDVAAMKLKLWMLLAQWAAPVSVTAEDRKVSDGTMGSTLYLKNATTAAVAFCDLARDMICVNGSSSSDPTATDIREGLMMLSIYALHALSVDAKALYYTLALHGRTNEQV
jgi:hypothetical protein